MIIFLKMYLSGIVRMARNGLLPGSVISNETEKKKSSAKKKSMVNTRNRIQKDNHFLGCYHHFVIN